MDVIRFYQQANHGPLMIWLGVAAILIVGIMIEMNVFKKLRSDALFTVLKRQVQWVFFALTSGYIAISTVYFPQYTYVDYGEMGYKLFIVIIIFSIFISFWILEQLYIEHDDPALRDNNY